MVDEAVRIAILQRELNDRTKGVLGRGGHLVGE
jgi:hypothetical protein